MRHSLNWCNVIPLLKMNLSKAHGDPWKCLVIVAASQMSDMSSWFQDQVTSLGTESSPVKFSLGDSLVNPNYSTSKGYVAIYRLGPRVHLFPRYFRFALLPLLMEGDCFARFAKPYWFRDIFLYQCPCPFFDVPFSSPLSHTHISSILHRTSPWQSVSIWPTPQPRTAPPMDFWRQTITNVRSPILGSRNYQVHEAALLQLRSYVGHPTLSFQVHLQTLSMDGNFRHS